MHNGSDSFRSSDSGSPRGAIQVPAHFSVLRATMLRQTAAPHRRSGQVVKGCEVNRWRGLPEPPRIVARVIGLHVDVGVVLGHRLQPNRRPVYPARIGTLLRWKQRFPRWPPLLPQRRGARRPPARRGSRRDGHSLKGGQRRLCGCLHPISVVLQALLFQRLLAPRGCGLQGRRNWGGAKHLAQRVHQQCGCRQT